MLGTPCIRRYRGLELGAAVIMRPVRAISRKGQELIRLLESSEAIRQPPRAIEVKIWSEPHGDMRRTRAKFLVG